MTQPANGAFAPVSTAAVAVPRRGVQPLLARGLYLGVVVVMNAVVVLGFWPFYAGLVTGGPASHWVIYLHAAVFSGWMVLLLAQTGLVFARRVRAHRQLGMAGLYYGLVVLVMGLVVSFVAPVINVTSGRSTFDENARFLILPLGDMLLFGGFFWAGMAYRRDKEWHKRLMLLATTALLFAPAARIGDPSLPLVLLIWLFPLGLAIAYDAFVGRRVHRVYVVGLAVLLIASVRVPLMESEAWLVVGRSLLGAMMR
jgi:hypothetical protein